MKTYYHLRDKEKSYKRHIHKSYPHLITENNDLYLWYNTQKEKQNNCCAICLKPEGKRRLSIDHNHKTKHVRGLLCSNCNTMLGLSHDNIETLIHAIEYLKNTN